MATGTYHKFNYLKFRMLEALLVIYGKLTCILLILTIFETDPKLIKVLKEYFHAK
jgi:hypothetical protein